MYAAKRQLGRGGWTWYTGSASWLYRIGLETILGFVKVGDTLRIDPCAPAAWPEYRLQYRYGDSTYLISVVSAARGQPGRTILDGRVLVDGVIQLVDAGATHNVQCERVS